MDELFQQTRAVFVADPVETKKFTKRIAFNVIPHIDVFMEDGYTKEEWKVLAETKKMLDPKIKVTCTAVRVPVFIGHSESVNIEFENEITADQARDILREAPGCLVIDKHEDGGYITRSNPPVRTQPTSRVSAKMRRLKTASTSGLFRTICARALPSMPSRSPNSWSIVVSSSPARRLPDLRYDFLRFVKYNPSVLCGAGGFYNWRDHGQFICRPCCRKAI